MSELNTCLFRVNNDQKLICYMKHRLDSLSDSLSLGYQYKKIIDVPLFELRVYDSVGEALPTNTDTFKYTVTL